MSEWQTIDTAPTDGTYCVLLCAAEIDRPGYFDFPRHVKRICIGNFDVGHDSYPGSRCWRSVDVAVEQYSGSEETGSWSEYYRNDITPTHWMGLPAPPETV